ncbi:MAG TPA: hypothetical protein VGN98_07790 [Tianweitania sediminis]|jgi:hypothetical protein|nr:hypothetical protein [Tianweitania sediminis]
MVELSETHGEQFDALDEEPEELPVQIEQYWRAFWELTTDRPVGMGVGSIPFSAIDRYATRFGIDEAEHFERFAALIRRMDGVYLKWSSEKRSERAG